MPRVKLDYVVSFSSEDPNNPASNLLAWEISKKKWLCSKWEPSCSVVLQLAKAVQIQSVHIGAYQASLVEVLVGLSEKPNDPFEVLVPSCVLVAPGEARRGAAERVRTFSADQLSAARAQRWDRLRVVCSQPYNKHCQYGLSFIHIYSPEADGNPAAPITENTTEQPVKAIPNRMFALDGLSSDEDEFKPGELFAKHRATESTDAQIRQASSNALKNISDSATKLTKTPISKTCEARHKNSAKKSDSDQTNRQRDSLMYTDDDDQPHGRIDRIVQKRKDEKSKEEINRQKTNEPKRKTTNERMKDLSNEIDKELNESMRDVVDGASSSKKRKRDSTNESKDKDLNVNKRNDANKMKRDKSDDRDETRKRKKVENNNGALRPGSVCSDIGQILAGTVLALSGYVHPRRGALRELALRLGAQYRPDYTRDCTHLICAFPNTPKLKAVRSADTPCFAVKGEWLEQCCAARRRLPEPWFATEPHLYVAPPKGGYTQYDDDDGGEEGGSKPGAAGVAPDSDADTEDEIEQVRQEQAKRDTQHTKQEKEQTDKQTEASDSDVSFVCDERVKGNITLHDDDSDDTEPEERTNRQIGLDKTKLLPSFLEGYTFVVCGEVQRAGHDVGLLRRHVRAYGGELLTEEEVTEDSEVHYIVCTSTDALPQCAGVRVSPRWLWRAHTRRRRPSDERDEIH
ncbi:DNA repair protein XRCC1 [Colias croceus]|uniref:DNA repair protein XRCC1 n=1 Tax=Colias crocea TaxID=72248 RepID=UPI001E27D67E|nr:DNA repair protein XRCC1 [Colias croceus]